MLVCRIEKASTWKVQCKIVKADPIKMISIPRDRCFREILLAEMGRENV